MDNSIVRKNRIANYNLKFVKLFRNECKRSLEFAFNKKKKKIETSVVWWIDNAVLTVMINMGKIDSLVIAKRYN